MSLLEEVEEPKAVIKYPDAKVFSGFVSALVEIMDEALFSITEEGMRVRGMDPAKISYIEVFMPREAFLEYELKEDSVEMGLNLDTLKSIVVAKKGNPIEFRVASNRVLVSIEDITIKRYVLPNLEVSVSVPEEVKLEHKARALLISDAFKKAVKDIEGVSDVLELKADEEQLVIGALEKKVLARFTRETSALLFLEVEEESSSKYDTSYVSRVTALSGVADTLEVGFSTEKPLELKFKSPDGSLVRYLLAPTI
ncbi:MAG: hypothetical protein QW065_03410 [Acidilobaceae archaeon]